MTIQDTLADIQHKLRAPKDKNNSFGGYKYRNAEGILAAFKALNVPGAALTCSDSVMEVAGQIFISATARLEIGGEVVTAQGHAMHPLQKKGMDASQITGSASSYARKYALCGLFAIEDESQDPDSRDNREESGQTAPPADHAGTRDRIKAAIDRAETSAALDKLWKHPKTCEAFASLPDDMKAELVEDHTRRSNTLAVMETPEVPDAGDGHEGDGAP